MTHDDLAHMSPLDALICGAVYLWFDSTGVERLHKDTDSLRRIAPPGTDIAACLQRLVDLALLSYTITSFESSYYTLPS